MTKYFTEDNGEYVEVNEELHTQEHVDKLIKERAERIARSQFGDYDELKCKAEKFDTTVKEYEGKLETANTEKSALVEELGKSKLEVEKIKIVTEFKLSDELAEFVTGKDASEMRQRAEKLAKGVKGGAFNIDKKDKPDPKSDNSKVLAGKLFGKKSDD